MTSVFLTISLLCLWIAVHYEVKTFSMDENKIKTFSTEENKDDKNN